MLIHKSPRIFDVDLYGISVVIALCVLTWLFLVKPLGEKAAQCRSSHAEIALRKDAASVELSGLRELSDRRRQLARRFSSTGEILQDSKGLPDAIRRFTWLSDESGLSLDGVKFASEVCYDYYRKSSLDLHLRGSFPQLNSLLGKLPESLSYVRVAGLSVDTARRDARIGRDCKITMQLDVFGPL